MSDIVLKKVDYDHGSLVKYMDLGEIELSVVQGRHGETRNRVSKL